jgi:hypothetical protein
MLIGTRNESVWVIERNPRAIPNTKEETQLSREHHKKKQRL